MSEAVTVTEIDGERYTNRVETTRHELIADEPEELGGADRGPAPYEYLCAALGACSSITMRMYVERKGWDVDRISVEVSHHKEQTDSGTRDVFQRRITLAGGVDEAQRERVLAIANKCPVHRTLESDNHIVTELVAG